VNAIPFVIIVASDCCLRLFRYNYLTCMVRVARSPHGEMVGKSLLYFRVD